MPVGNKSFSLVAIALSVPGCVGLPRAAAEMPLAAEGYWECTHRLKHAKEYQKLGRAASSSLK